MEDYLDDNSSPAEGEDQSVATEDNPESNVPENKLALVQSSFFKGPVKPGDRETVEVVSVYENEVSVKCVTQNGDDYDQESNEDMGMESESGPSEDDEGMY